MKRQIAINIGNEMENAGLPSDFVIKAVKVAMVFEGVHDLFVMWRDESEKIERNSIISDIKDLIDDAYCSVEDPVEK